MKNDASWKVHTREGTPIEGVVQLSGKKGRNCWANRAFAQWWVNIVSKAFERYKVPIWGTDAGSIW